MDKLTQLTSAPDRSFNAIVERVGALMLHHAAVEGVCDAEQAANSNDDRNDCHGGGPSTGLPIHPQTNLDETTATVCGLPGLGAGNRQPGCGVGGVVANEVDGDVAADEAGGVTAQGDTASNAMASVTCDEAAPAQEPVSFRNVTCHGTACNVELQAGEVGFVSSDGGQSVDGLPLVLPLELVQEFKTTTAIPKVAACLLTISTDVKPLELSFLAQSAFAAIQKEHVKARDRFLCALEAATTTCIPHPPLRTQWRKHA
jgi:hypothetical protein